MLQEPIFLFKKELSYLPDLQEVQKAPITTVVFLALETVQQVLGREIPTLRLF